MFLTKKFILILSIFSSTLLAQQSAPASQQLSDRSRYELGAGDQIKIWSLGLEEFYNDKLYRIEPGGDLDLPMAGKIHATGLTVEQLKAELVKRFAKEVLTPQVSIEIVEYGSQPVSVMGAVNHPGVHQLQGHKTLAEVISLADGLKENAGPHITISRQIENGPIPLLNAKTDPSGRFSVAQVEVHGLLAGTRPAENILVSPNDVITVPVAESVFVLGEVHKPGEVPMRNMETITVLQALAHAEGFGPTPAAQSSKIIRIVPGSKERQEIPVDLKKVIAGKAEDVALRPYDILVVPPSAPKKMAARALEAAIQAATGMAVWGVR